MVDRPILFSGAMVRSLLAGTKTQTRRALKLQPCSPYQCVSDGDRIIYRVPVPYVVGDHLWVREAWRVSKKWDGTKPRDLPPRTMTTFYEAGGSMGGVDPCPKDRVRTANEYHVDSTYLAAMPDWVCKRRPGMFMMRWMSRLTLTVTGVRIQRLQEIGEADALAEGIAPLPSGRYHCGHDDEGEITCKSPVTAYAWLWNSLNGERPGCHWQDNPWVCAVSFSVERRNIDAVTP